MLSAEEVDQINAYHAMVVDQLADLLSDEELAWLKNKCKKISK